MDGMRTVEARSWHLLIGLGVVALVIALIWWLQMLGGAQTATAGPLLVAAAGAFAILVGVILYVGRRD